MKQLGRFWRVGARAEALAHWCLAARLAELARVEPDLERRARLRSDCFAAVDRAVELEELADPTSGRELLRRTARRAGGGAA